LHVHTGFNFETGVNSIHKSSTTVDKV